MTQRDLPICSPSSPTPHIASPRHPLHLRSNSPYSLSSHRFRLSPSSASSISSAIYKSFPPLPNHRTASRPFASTAFANNPLTASPTTHIILHKHHSLFPPDSSNFQSGTSPSSPFHRVTCRSSSETTPLNSGH